MVISAKQSSAKRPAKQGVAEDAPEPIKINSSTPFDFDGKNLTAYGGLLPVAIMLEKLQFPQLVEASLTVKRVTRAMPMYQFVLAMVLALYVGFSRLNHLRFLAREPMLMGILKVLELPVPTKKSVLIETVEVAKPRRVGCLSHVYPFRLPAFHHASLFSNSDSSASRNPWLAPSALGPATHQPWS
jgi:hypothetical protein